MSNNYKTTINMPKKVPQTPRARRKMKKVMHEFKHGSLQMGQSGKKVKNRKQAIAIGLSEARKANKK